jgi:hypothetical protein
MGDIKIKLQQVGWGVDCVDLSLDRDKWWVLVNAVMNVWVL